MNSSLLSRITLVLVALAVWGCSGSSNGPDGNAQGNDAIADLDGAADQDGSTGMDGRQARDVNGGEVVLADTIGSCLLEISPTHGSASTTFVASGVGYTETMVVARIFQGSMASGPILHMDTVPTTSDGAGGYMFMYTIPTSTLATGTYTLEVFDMMIRTCTSDSSFMIN